MKYIKSFLEKNSINGGKSNNKAESKHESSNSVIHDEEELEILDSIDGVFAYLRDDEFIVDIDMRQYRHIEVLITKENGDSFTTTELEDNILMMVELIKNKWKDCEVLYKYSLKNKKTTIKTRDQLKVYYTYIFSDEQSNIFPKNNDVKNIKIIIDGNKKSDVIKNKQTEIYIV